MRCLAVLAVASLAAGCSSDPSFRRGAGKGGMTRAIEIAAAQPADRYNDPPRTEPPDTELTRALLPVVAQVAAATRARTPVADGRLCAVAEAIAAFSDDSPPPYAAVEFALAQHGIIEPSPHLVVVRAGTGQLADVAEELRGRLGEVLAAAQHTRVGVGSADHADGTTSVVVALQESFVETEPVPRGVEAGARVPLRGQLKAPYTKPELFVTGPGGQVTRLAIVLDGERGFRASLACVPRGRQQVEVVGHDGGGASVLANFPIWCGEAPPRSFRLEAMPEQTIVADGPSAERKVFELANADRVRAGLAALAWDERAAAVARGHSKEMLATGVVSHVSPTTGSAADRVKRAKISTPLVLENLARAYSPEEAHQGLMNSPGHRANLLSSDATHLGVGVSLGRLVAGRPELYVTQVFLRVPPAIDPRVARAQVRDAIAARRKTAGVKALGGDAELDRIAQELADGLSDGMSRDLATSRADRSVDGLAGRLASVITLIVQGEPAAAAVDATADPTIDLIGVGVGQAARDEASRGLIHVVVLMGKKR